MQIEDALVLLFDSLVQSHKSRIRSVGRATGVDAATSLVVEYKGEESIDIPSEWHGFGVIATRYIAPG